MTVGLVVGVGLHLVGCAGTSLGLVLQKVAHVKMEGTGLSVQRSRWWTAGIIVYYTNSYGRFSEYY